MEDPAIAEAIAGNLALAKALRDHGSRRNRRVFARPTRRLSGTLKRPVPVRRKAMHMDGMEWMMGGMGLLGFLLLVLLILGIAALIKYLLSRGK
jgi:hypothetical protein